MGLGMPAKGEFPTRENCNPEEPEEAFLWMFVALPHVRGGPLIMPVEYYRYVSKRLWDLGARPVAEPTLEYVPPSANAPNAFTSPGSWVAAGSVPQGEKDKREAQAGLSRMGHQQRVELYQALVAWRDGQTLPETTAGGVVASMNDSARILLLSLLESGDTT